jgi:hypothetical protein
MDLVDRRYRPVGLRPVLIGMSSLIAEQADRAESSGHPLLELALELGVLAVDDTGCVRRLSGRG